MVPPAGSPAPLDYASSREPRRRPRLPPAAWVALDLAAVAFLVSQYAFLLAMMAINVRGSGVPPYGYGSGYRHRALGNADFVRAHPAVAAFVAERRGDRLEILGFPAAVANALTLTGVSWAVAAYLVWRCFRTRGARRVMTALVAVLALVTLPYVYPALLVWLD
jgi:hypothetical protein